MAHRVVWSPRAVTDLEAIANYISSDSPSYARGVVRGITTATRVLAQFPRSGRVVPEFGDDQLRELVVYSYRVIYHVSASEVTIAAVIHGKRNL